MASTCGICNREIKHEFLKNVEMGGKIYDIYQCRECMVGFTVPAPSPEELSELYHSGNYRLSTGKRFNPYVESLIYGFRLLRKRRIRKYIKKGRILDIGYGRGLFLNIMKKGGWEVTGVEFSKETASYASDLYGIKVITETSIHELPDESFDVITMNHVLEHSRKPSELISECRRLLRKGGLVVVAVPNTSSLQASAGKGVWFHLDLPFHFNHFSEEGLIRLLNKNPFDILKIKQFDMEYNPFGWIQTLLNLSSIRKNLLYDLLKSGELRKGTLNALKRDVILTFVLLPLYFPLSFILSVFESLILKRGGTIEVYAVKR